MFFLARLMTRFDEALDWPADLFLDDDQPVEDWTPIFPARPIHHAA